MSYRFDYDSTNRILRCRFEGRLTAEELANYLRIVGQYVAQTGPRGGITDLSAVTFIKATPEGVRRLANLKPAVPLMNRPRVVLAPSDYTYGMARMFEIEAVDVRPNLHVVRTLKEAQAILGVQEFRFEPIPEAKSC
jgi:hypothetical protein